MIDSFKIFAITAIATLLTASTSAQSHCQTVFKDTPLSSKIASAGFFANARGSAGSVKVESAVLLRQAEELLPSQLPPALTCPQGCVLAKAPAIFFRSIPQKFLSDYSDSEYCQTLEVSTRQSPIQYTRHDVRSLENLNDWIGELSQGKGKAGADLYDRCDKSCSPQYEYRILKSSEMGGTRTASASIVCGAARDKDDDMYQLTSFFRWSCETQ